MCSELFSSAHFLTITTVIKTSFPTPAGKLYCWVAMTLPPLLMILWTANLHDTISKVAKIFSNWLLYHAIEDCYLCCPTSRGCEQTKKDLGRGKLRLSLNTNEWWLSRLLTNKQCSLPLRIFLPKSKITPLHLISMPTFCQVDWGFCFKENQFKLSSGPISKDLLVVS